MQCVSVFVYFMSGIVVLKLVDVKAIETWIIEYFVVMLFADGFLLLGCFCSSGFL